MKRRLAAILAMILLICGTAAALAAAKDDFVPVNEVNHYVEALGLSPVVAENASGVEFCAFHAALDGVPAMISWADAESVYTIDNQMLSKDPQMSLAHLYWEILGLRLWPVAWSDDGNVENPRVLYGYNAASVAGQPEEAFETLAEYAAALRAQEEAEQITYVLNTNTHKMHRPDCQSVSQIKDKNRRDFTGTREEAVNMGYVPCKKCNP